MHLELRNLHFDCSMSDQCLTSSNQEGKLDAVLVICNYLLDLFKNNFKMIMLKD